ncbi:Gfo/Idh/MocA family protein [Halomicrococcus sp. SG-WS-1]|uniref:Gfo/Idh/MocA family protein n=1 Tax=Halomicrococcus sp. SG-WS-1 TaxID=3439057 RepID=UPI003F78D2CA
MSNYRVAFIGTGPDPGDQNWGTSAAMAYRHAAAYDDLDDCSLVGCADLVRENAAAFADRFDLPASSVFEDYVEMLEAVEPDVVSVCTPVPTHADIVVDCAESGIPAAIHCEKPMADTWGDCRRMTETCDRADVQLTFNHQRRFSGAYRKAYDLIEDGFIGDPRRFEVGGQNLFDFGSHLIDICNGINAECEAEWALCQVDYREENVRYGSHNENQALALWRYENGVHAILSSGVGHESVRCYVRVRGTKGTVELWPDEGPELRVRQTGEEEFEAYDVEEPYETMLHGAVREVVDCLESGETPDIGAENVLTANEIIYGCWESARRRGRVEFPLDIADNPLDAMVEAEDLTPRPAESDAGD